MTDLLVVVLASLGGAMAVWGPYLLWQWHKSRKWRKEWGV